MLNSQQPIQKNETNNQLSEQFQEKQQPEKQQSQQQQDVDSQQSEQISQKWKKIQKPQQCVDLYMIDFNQCDSKKCSGRKLQRFGLVKPIKDKKKKFRGIVLSALGQQVISKQDLEICKKSGICVIDCSWKRLKETQKFRFKNQRILPYVVAGNPVNYGKPYQLSCVEALATALCVINYVPQAEYIMSKFGWADGFWSINPGVQKYSLCSSVKQVRQLSQVNENEVLNNNPNKNYDMPSSSSSQSQSHSEQDLEKAQQKVIEEDETKNVVKQQMIQNRQI